MRLFYPLILKSILLTGQIGDLFEEGFEYGNEDYELEGSSGSEAIFDFFNGSRWLGGMNIPLKSQALINQSLVFLFILTSAFSSTV